MNTEINRDYDLNEHLARGRQLRSAAVLNAFAWAVRGFKRILATGEAPRKPTEAV